MVHPVDRSRARPERPLRPGPAPRRRSDRYVLGNPPFPMRAPALAAAMRRVARGGAAGSACLKLLVDMGLRLSAPRHRLAPETAAPEADTARGLRRYQLVVELGRGAMGAVYLGKDPRINRPVAIKAIPIEKEFEDEELKEARLRFYREAESAGRLTHPNIIKAQTVQQLLGLLRWQGSREVVSLSVVALEGAQLRQLLGGLDSLRNDLHAKNPCVDHRKRDCGLQRRGDVEAT